MLPRFQLDISREELAAWGKVSTTSLPEIPFEQRLYSHQHYPVLRASVHPGQHEIAWMREGLIPSYAHDEEGADERATAHAESLTCTSCFRSAFRRRRCLVPATRMFQCRHDPSGLETPCSFALTSGAAFSLAAVWESWQNDDGHAVQTFAVVTSLVAPLLRSIFDRLPVVIEAADQSRWLRSSTPDAPPLDLLKPLSAAELRAWDLTPCAQQTTAQL